MFFFYLFIYYLSPKTIKNVSNDINAHMVHSFTFWFKQCKQCAA